MCPLDADLMKKILNRHCVHCSELINEVITLPQQVHEQLKGIYFLDQNKCAINFEKSAIHKEFSKYCLKKYMFGATYQLMDEQEVDPDNDLEMDDYQEKKFQDSVYIP